MKRMFSRSWRFAPYLLFAYPLVSFAQTQGLVPCGFATGTGDYYTNSTSCDLCSFGQLIQNIINFMVGISIPLAALMFAWAGILYFTSVGNPTQVLRARKIFTSVFVGFLLVISAWLIVQTILSTLVKGTVWFGGSWNSLQCTDPATRPRNATIAQWLGGVFSGGNGGTGGQTNPGVTPVPTPGGSGGMSEADARARLAAAGVQVNAAQCASGVSTGCTTLAGESENNINQIINLSNACRQNDSSCQVVISGGAEPHGATKDPHAGGTAIDVRSNPALDQYIKSLTPAASFTPTAFKDMAGNVYTLEGVGGSTGSTGAHWHVDLYQGKKI